MSEVKQPELRASDKHGNVRPADDRFLSSGDKKKRDAYVAKVDAALAKEAKGEPVQEDPYADVINDAVETVLTRPDASPSTGVLETDVTPVTSPRGSDPNQQTLLDDQEKKGAGK